MPARGCAFLSTKFISCSGIADVDHRGKSMLGSKLGLSAAGNETEGETTLEVTGKNGNGCVGGVSESILEIAIVGDG